MLKQAEREFLARAIDNQPGVAMQKYSFDDIAAAILTFVFCAAPIAMVVVVLFAAQ